MRREVALYPTVGLCLVFVASARGASASGDEPAEIAGPAQVQWGSTIVCALPPATKVPPGRCTWHLRERGREDIFAHGDVMKCQPAADARISLSLRLPDAPDPAGNADGDFDLSFTVASNDEQNELGSAHPIHIETRDRNGHVAGRYVPRNYDLFAAQAGPAEMKPEWLTQNGLRNGRTDVSWGNFEPEDGKWEQKAFEKLDRILRLTLRYDMTVLLTLGGTPAWASYSGEGGWKPAKDPQRWAAFVDRVVGHFAKAPYYQRHWQIWNEAPAYPF